MGVADRSPELRLELLPQVVGSCGLGVLLIRAGRELLEREHTRFRGLAARANYLAADRPDIVFAAKEICRWMQEPTGLGVQALKRLARSLVGKPRLIFNYPWQEACAGEVYSDTDWAGCVLGLENLPVEAVSCWAVI